MPDEALLDCVDADPDWLHEFGPRETRDSDRVQRPGPAVGGWDDGWTDPAPRGLRSVIGARLRGTPRTALALCLVGVVAALVALYAVVSSPSTPRHYPVVAFDSASTGSGSSPARVAEAQASAASPAAAAVAPAPAALTIAVVGLVRLPGLHRVAPSARVADALAVAGGATRGADTVGLNLAQPLHDGDQVVVGTVDRRNGPVLRSAIVPAGGMVVASGTAGTAGAGGTGPGAGAPSGRVNINMATAAELDALPGVGAATAAAIVAYRDRNGPFASVDDLAKVSGIGPAKLARIAPNATV